MATGDKTYYASQAQLNAKITEPEVEGTAGSVLTTDGEGGRVWSELTAVDSIVIDTQLSSTSTNPIQNKVVSSELGQLNQAITDLDDEKLDIPTGTPVVGKTIKIKTVNQDGTFVCEWADGSAGGVTDVKANGTSIVDEDGVANIPIGTNTSIGLVRGNANYGAEVSNTTGVIMIARAPDTVIASRTSLYRPIVPYNLNYAVTAALTDANHISLDATQQSTAQNVLGINMSSKVDISVGVMIDNDGHLYIENGEDEE